MSLTDLQRKQLQKALGRETLSERDKTRVQIMLLFDEGKSQKQICEQLACSTAMARLWIRVVREGQAHRWQEFCQDGRPGKVTQQYRDRLQELIAHYTPKDFGFAFPKWTAKALQIHLNKELHIEVSVRQINRLRREITLATKPHTEVPQKGASQSKLVIRDLPFRTL